MLLVIISVHVDYSADENRDHIRDEIKRELSRQVREQVALQLKEHIPITLDEQRKESRAQLVEVKHALRNS